MKIGIIVHSQTGHTNEVAQKLQEKLSAALDEVEIQQLRLEGGQQVSNENSKIENPPDVSAYDALIFGAPVQAFSLSKVMNIYLEQIPSLQDKKIALFVTKGLRFEWTGGTRAIGQMKKICQSKGGIIMGTGIIVWNKQRDGKIDEVAQKFSELF
ncbi:MAG: flavodoxin [Methanobacterium sp.]|uniref:flavodoxin family protein n=1 Tax=Methanobacterium sp. TaxID=2164 RepID=UPI003D64B983|nr:flavodoxin [Methanobacterium sp.]